MVIPSQKSIFRSIIILHFSTCVKASDKLFLSLFKTRTMKKHEIKIQVGTENKGFIFSLPPSQILRIKNAETKANPLTQLFLRFDQNIDLLSNKPELEKILPILTGLTTSQIQNFTFEFSDVEHGKVMFI